MAPPAITGESTFTMVLDTRLNGCLLYSVSTILVAEIKDDWRATITSMDGEKIHIPLTYEDRSAGDWKRYCFQFDKDDG
ncbi:hypothetical protein TWF281_010239 [Arthrobotrys megalospora]